MKIRKILAVFFLMGALVQAHPGNGPIKVKTPWIREVLPGQDMTAAYLLIQNTGRDPEYLVSVSCDCASSAEVHRMVHSGGVMRMEPAGRLEIPAGGKLELAPGGTHVMLFGLKTPLREGEKANLILHFEHAGGLKVEAVVKPAEGKRHDS